MKKILFLLLIIFGLISCKHKEIKLMPQIKVNNHSFSNYASIKLNHIHLNLNVDFKQVNFVHDEWQIEVSNNLDLAKKVANIVAGSLRKTGEILNLNCPLEGSIINRHNEIAIGHNWSETH
jgi:hypothetical protein